MLLGTPRGFERVRSKHRMTIFNTQKNGDFLFFFKNSEKTIDKTKTTAKISKLLIPIKSNGNPK